ncbi:MAG: hypothetical protein ACRER4_07210 [Steroidobacteraceae bacterium]
MEFTADSEVRILDRERLGMGIGHQYGAPPGGALHEAYDIRRAFPETP